MRRVIRWALAVMAATLRSYSRARTRLTTGLGAEFHTLYAWTTTVTGCVPDVALGVAVEGDGAADEGDAEDLGRGGDLGWARRFR